MYPGKIFLGAAALLLCGGLTFAQKPTSNGKTKSPSTAFTMGQWIEVENAILKELQFSYVDSLPLSRIRRAGIDEMLSNLDPYTVYIPEEEDEDLELLINKAYGGIGAIIYKPDKDGNVFINEPYAGSPAVRAGLRCGDQIMEVDGVSTHGLDASQSSERMKGKPGTTVVFKIQKAVTGEIVEVPVVRERIKIPDVEYAGMIDGNTGYILQTGFTEGVSSAVRTAVLSLKAQGMQKLVLDLRGNGGGLMSEAINIVSLFVPKGSLVVTQKGKEGTRSVPYHTTMEPVDTKIPLIVLVDGGTASSSEIVSGALQDLDRATIMGRRTYGKGLVQSIRPLPYNGQIKVTVAKYYTPSGRCVQAIDYANRGEDGSVKHIPDSLTKVFHTAGGRVVRDGGGITPDQEIPTPVYSRLVYSLVLNGIIDHYALDYASRHATIAALDDFHFDEYDDFVAFAMKEKFDYRSSAKTLFDQMCTELSKDGLADSMKDQLDAMSKALDIDKEAFLRLKKDEIIPWIEEEIAVRYYYQEAGVKVRLRYDKQLHEALSRPLITDKKEE